MARKMDAFVPFIAESFAISKIYIVFIDENHFINLGNDGEKRCKVKLALRNRE